jgi:hypothetical protein
MEKKHLRKKEQFIKYLLENHYHFKFIMKDDKEEGDCSLFYDLREFMENNQEEDIDRELDEDNEISILPIFDTNKHDPYSYYDEDDNEERYKRLHKNSKKLNKLKGDLDEYKDPYYNLKNIKNIVITDENYNIDFSRIYSIPDGVIFKNNGNLIIPDIYKIPSNTEFRNEGHVFMEYIKSIGENVLFMNEDKVHIRFLNIGSNIAEMYQEGDLLDGILERMGSYNPLAKDTASSISERMGIEGISISRVLNKTISRINKN